jgi:hypothetical protein
VKKILIFCQAPADIKYALTIYERYKNDSDISIFTINVEGMYEFINNLNLDLASLVHIHYPEYKIKNPISILKAKKYIRKKYKQFFINRERYHIYYFSNHYDFLTFYFLRRLSDSSSIFFVNHYDDLVSKNFKKPIFNIKDSVKMLILNSLSGCFLKFYSFNNRIIPKFPYKKFKIKELKTDILDDEIYRKYAYNIKAVGKKILYLEMDYGKVDLFDNYKKTTISFIEILREKGYKIYLKPHPRLGYSKFLDEYIYKIVNKDVPAEFIEIDNFDYVLGISSSAIAYFSKKQQSKVFSLLELYEYKSYEVKTRAKEYLEELTNHVNFLKNIKEIEKRF